MGDGALGDAGVCLRIRMERIRLCATGQPHRGGSSPRAWDSERDPEGRNLFVDTFGAEFGRDIEPTVEYGSEVYDLMTSCARVFHRNAATGARGATMPPKLAAPATGRHLPNRARGPQRRPRRRGLVDLAERADDPRGCRPSRSSLSARGTIDLLPRGDEPSTPLGPFIAFGSGGAGRRALHRCIIGNRHFYSLAAGCEGQVFDGTLAFLQEAPSSEMPRRIQRCFHPTTGEHTVALGFDCPAGFTTVETLGYVR